MKKRRFIITEDEGEAISFALDYTIKETEKVLNSQFDPFLNWMLGRMRKIRDRIKEYKWFTE